MESHWVYIYTTCFHCLMLRSWGSPLLRTAAIYSLYWWIAFDYVNRPRFVFLVHSEWICELFLVFGYQEQRCCKCPCTGPHVQAFLRVTLCGHRTCASSTLPDNSKLFCTVVWQFPRPPAVPESHVAPHATRGAVTLILGNVVAG